MYRYVSALVTLADDRGIWYSADLKNTKVKEIIKDYAEAAITLYNPYTKENIIITLDSFYKDWSSFDGTIDDYLESIGNRNLDTSDYVYTVIDAHLKYDDFFRNEFDLQPCDITKATDVDLAIEDKPDIIVKKEDNRNFNFITWSKSAIPIVNGYLHFMEKDSGAAYIRDGMKNVLQSNMNLCGYLDFSELGEVDIIKITEDMIYTKAPSNKLYDHCIIDFNKNSENKSVFISIGGYFHCFDWLSARRISNTEMRIDFKNIPLIPRIMESLEFLDFSTAPVETNFETEFAVKDLLSNEFIKWYLTTMNSFIIIVDNYYLSATKQNVVSSLIPGQYIAHTNPVGPLIMGHGKMGNYWKVEDDSQWALNLYNNHYDHYQFEFKPKYINNIAANAARHTQMKFHRSSGWLLDLSSNIKKQLKKNN